VFPAGHSDITSIPVGPSAITFSRCGSESELLGPCSSARYHLPLFVLGNSTTTLMYVPSWSECHHLRLVVLGLSPITFRPVLASPRSPSSVPGVLGAIT
jgi:hypothetical protein